MALFRNGGFAAHLVNSPAAVRRAPTAPAAAWILMLASFQYFAGCTLTGPARPAVRLTGDALLDDQAQLAAAPPRDRVLWEYRIAAEALRRGEFAEAKSRLDDALRALGGLLAGPDDAAQRARGYFAGEATKTFIGEPYERVMAYYYRGILYWRDGEPDNARACFRSAALSDADLLAHQYNSDYVLLDYLDGLATAKLGGDGAEAFARAQANTKLSLPPYDRDANVLCFVEYGRGPLKYATGAYGEQLRFEVTPSRTHSGVLTVDGRKVALPPYDDLDYQATTRGGRVMDYVLRNKAVFKSTTDAIGDAALVGAAIAHDVAEDRRSAGKSGGSQNDTAAALAVAGVLSKVVSAAANPEADTRAWDNLPQYLSFAALRLAPGPHAARLEFFDAQGRALPEFTRNLTINVADSDQATVVFLSELARS
jgi:tetratricopeptide (TPR) repeat protein